MILKDREATVAVDPSKSVLRLAWQVSALISLAVSAIAAFTIIMLPVNTDLSAFEGVLLPSVIMECKPERDIIGYGAFAVLFPLLHTVLIHFFRKRFTDQSKRIVRSCEIVDFLWSVGIFSFAVIIFCSFYLHPYYANRYLFGRAEFFLAVVCAVFAFAVCIMKKRNRLRTANEISAVVLGIAFLVLVMYAVGKYNYMHSYTPYNLHHYSAWWVPIYKVGSGMTLGDGFNELYGFYPYFIVPVLKLFGGVNQQSLSAYMSLVFVIMAACVLGFCYRFFKNKLLGVICGMGFFTLGPLAFIGNTELYFQYYPTRALFVFLVLGLIAIYCTVKKFHGLLMAFGTVLCAVAIMWNTESGMVAAIVWAGFLILEKALYFRLTDKEMIKRIVIAVLSTVASVVLFVIVIEAITYSRAGIFLGKDDILFGIVTFSGAGFFMLPLELGIWVVVAAALAYGLYSSVPYLAFARRKGEDFHGDKDSVTALFMASVAGVGCFMYFMGRSFPTNCMTFLPWVVMICSLLADRNMSSAENIEYSGDTVKGKASTIMKNVVCFMTVGVALSAAITMTGNVFDKDSKFNKRFGHEQPAFAEMAAQINDWKHNECGGETPYIFHLYASFIQEEMGVPARENVYEQINWFHYDDVYTYISFIKEHPGAPFVVDASAINKLSEYFPDEWTEIKNNYVLRKVSKHNVYVENESAFSYLCLYMPKQ